MSEPGRTERPEANGGRRDNNRGGDRRGGGRGGDRPPFEGNKDGSMRAIQNDFRRVAEELKNKIDGINAPKQKEAGPENKTAKLILEIGKISITIKDLCRYISKYTKLGDTESSEVVEYKQGVINDIKVYFDLAEQLQELILDKNKPSLEDMESIKAQCTIHMLEFLRMAEYIDSEIVMLPKEGPEWRRFEKIKNELRTFTGDLDAITELPPLSSSPLRPEPASSPRIPEKNTPTTEERPSAKNDAADSPSPSTPEESPTDRSLENKTERNERGEALLSTIVGKLMDIEDDTEVNEDLIVRLGGWRSVDIPDSPLGELVDNISQEDASYIMKRLKEEGILTS